jgi:hypothetical protein
MSQTASDYRQLAALCTASAEEVKIRHQRNILLQMALHWSKLAENLEAVRRIKNERSSRDQMCCMGSSDQQLSGARREQAS